MKAEKKVKVPAKNLAEVLREFNLLLGPTLTMMVMYTPSRALTTKKDNNEAMMPFTRASDIFS